MEPNRQRDLARLFLFEWLFSFVELPPDVVQRFRQDDEIQDLRGSETYGHMRNILQRIVDRQQDQRDPA